jgi:hypothetical protein
VKTLRVSLKYRRPEVFPSLPPSNKINLRAGIRNLINSRVLGIVSIPTGHQSLFNSMNTVVVGWKSLVSPLYTDPVQYLFEDL